MAVLEEESLVLLTEEYIAILDRLADTAGAMTREVFLSLDHLNRAELLQFIKDAGPILRGARSEAIDLTTGYLAEATGTNPNVVDLSDFEAQFDQPFLRTWHNLKEGHGWEDARQGGASQAEALGNDVTVRGAADRMANPGTKVRGYRRVLSGDACEWCRVVSTQMYKSAESATFGHHACKCKIIAVPLGADPGFAINKARLKGLKASGAVGRVSKARARSR